MNKIDPRDAKPDEVYEGTADGETWTMRRLGDVPWATQWLAMGVSPDHPWKWFWDKDVSDLVRLVPARPDRIGVDWKAMYEQASRERDEAERERDEWKERAESAEQKYGTERLRWERAREHHANHPKTDIPAPGMSHMTVISDIQARWKEAAGQRDEYHAQLDDAVRERDEWKARAEKAERLPASPGMVSESRYRRVNAEWQRQSKIWGEKRARYEATIDELRARAAPTVTRDDLEKCVQKALYGRPGTQSIRALAVADAMCVLFGVEADPVLSRAREYAAAVGIDWNNAEPEDVDLLMKVAEHVIGGESDE